MYKSGSKVWWGEKSGPFLKWSGGKCLLGSQRLIDMMHD